MNGKYLTEELGSRVVGGGDPYGMHYAERQELLRNKEYKMSTVDKLKAYKSRMKVIAEQKAMSHFDNFVQLMPEELRNIFVYVSGENNQFTFTVDSLLFDVFVEESSFRTSKIYNVDYEQDLIWVSDKHSVEKLIDFILEKLENE